MTYEHLVVHSFLNKDGKNCDYTDKDCTIVMTASSNNNSMGGPLSKTELQRNNINDLKIGDRIIITTIIERII